MSASSSTFTPFLMNITSITNAQQAVVGFATAHPFTLGEIVSFRVSQPYGMTEINNLAGLVTGVGSTNITVNINTATWTAFVFPPVGQVVYPAVCVPAGSGIVPGNVSPPQTNLLDVFDNTPST